MRQKIDPDADQHGGGPAAAIYVLMQEQLACDGVGDQRERSRSRRNQAQVQMIQSEEQREESQGKKANTGKEQRAGNDGPDRAFDADGRESHRDRQWISWQRR